MAMVGLRGAILQPVTIEHLRNAYINAGVEAKENPLLGSLALPAKVGVVVVRLVPPLVRSEAVQPRARLVCRVQGYALPTGALWLF